MASKYASPSAFEGAVQNLGFRIMHLTGRAGRISTTLAPAATLAQSIASDRGRIMSVQLKALDTGTTSSATFNTIGLYVARAGSATLTQLGVVRTNRGANGANASLAPLSGASALVNVGDLLAVRRLTKLNGGSQLFVDVVVDKEVS